MLPESELRALAELALEAAAGMDAEVVISSGQRSLTRFGDNVITQNVSSKTNGLSIRLIKDGKVGKAVTGNLSKSGIEKCVATAKVSLAVNEPDDEIQPLPGPQTYEPRDVFAQSTLDASPETRADGVVQAIETFKKQDLVGAGIYSTGGSSMLLANSNGLRSYHQSTVAEFSISAMSDNSSGWCLDTGHDVNELNLLKTYETASRKAIASRNPIEVEPGEWTVVLEPAAVCELMTYLGWDGFNGLSYVEDRSCFSGKAGQQVLGKNISITDDAWHPLTGGMPFDYEGLPRHKVKLIENGIFLQPVHDRRTAKRAGVESTGHGLPQPDSSGPFPLNLVFSPGDSSVEEMIQNTKRGLLVTRFHYVNQLNPMTVTLTGMTRDGLFLIEDGEVKQGVKNMRFTESIIHVLNNVRALSRQLYRTETFWGGGGIVVPAMHIDGFHFTSKTGN